MSVCEIENSKQGKTEGFKKSWKQESTSAPYPDVPAAQKDVPTMVLRLSRSSRVIPQPAIRDRKEVCLVKSHAHRLDQSLDPGAMGHADWLVWIMWLQAIGDPVKNNLPVLRKQQRQNGKKREQLFANSHSPSSECL